MPAKIRLARHGSKRNAFYYIVVTDSRAPRDGRFIERIGSYNPNTNPATIDLDFDKALNWLKNGAQPTDTCRAILSYKGVLIKKHLLEGVRKGAFSEEEAENRFQSWMKEQEAKIQAKKDRLSKAKNDAAKKKLEEETKVNEARLAELAKKQLAEQEAQKKAEEKQDEATSEPVSDEVTTDSVEETKPEEITAADETPEEKQEE